jgi:Arc/MetJ family transcription regulator
VYARCMTRTNIDIDEAACEKVMRRYGLRTKREAVNFALRELAAEMSVAEARGLKGSGWEGDLEQMRSTRTTA